MPETEVMQFLNSSLTTQDFVGRSLESPTVSLNDPSAFDFLGIGTQPIAAGVRVDRRTVMTLDTWYRAVDLVSDYIMRCSLKIRRWTASDNSVPDVEHPAYRLLFQQANQFYGSRYWKKVMQAHAANHGNAYSWIERNKNADPIGLVPLAPDRTYPIRVNGRRWYVSHVAMDYLGGTDGAPDNKNEPVATTMVLFKPEDIFHLKGLGYDGMAGYTTFDMAAETAGHALATRQYGARYFANNGEPRVLIEMPAGQIWTILEKQEFLREWNTMHAGVSNSHRTAILTNGAKAVPFDTNAEKSQLVENRKMSPREIANFHKLPPHKLGDESRTSYNSLELEEYAILNDCLEPWFALWEEECELKLLTEKQKRSYSHFAHFDRNELIHTTAAERAKANASNVNNGLRTADEARALDGLPALPDGVGSVVRCPVNIAILHEAKKPPAVAISGVPQKQGEVPAPAGTPKPADQKSRRDQQPDLHRDKTAKAEADKLINAGWIAMRRDELANLSHPEHCPCIELLPGLDAKVLGRLNEHDVLALSFDMAGSEEYFNEPDLIVAGNHERWEFIDPSQYWVDSGYQFGDVLHDLLHEAIEETIMRELGWLYAEAHRFANKKEFDYVEELLAAAKEKLAKFLQSHPADEVTRDAAGRIYSRLAKDMQRAVANPKTFGNWKQKARNRHAAPIARILGIPLRLKAAAGEAALDPGEAAGRIIAAWLDSRGDAQKFNVEVICKELEVKG